MKFKVILNGKDSGILETSFKFALHYWLQRALRREIEVKLEPVK